VLVARLVRRIGRLRPVVVWLDDVQWDLDSIAFTQHVMLQEPSSRLPVLLLLTAATEALAERGDEARQLAACGAHPAASTLTVEPLPQADWPDLVAKLLRLEAPLAARVAARTRGNPLFAVQLVGEWVARGVVEMGRDGFRLQRGTAIELPDALHDMWRERIERLLAGRSASEEMALELAATLGQVVDADEWRRACALGGVAAPETLVEELIARRLASADARGLQHGWSFVHAMLHDNLERRAEEAGRAAVHHRTCAEMLRERKRPGVAERLARHLTAAGELRAALAPLRDAARERLDRGDYSLSDALLAEREDALVALRRDEADAHWAEGWILRGELALKRGLFEVGLKWATLAAQAASEQGWEGLEAEALGLRARIERMLGEPRKAENDLRRAEALARSSDERKLLAEILQTLGRLLMHKGELCASASSFQEARALYEALADNKGVADARWSLAHLTTYLERYDEALDHNEAALVALRQWGDRWGVARSLNTAGELTRIRGDLDAAVRYYREARDLMRALGATDSVAICDSNIARVLAQRGDYPEARVRLERGLVAFEEQARKNPLAWVQVVLLLCDAGQRDWLSWDRHWQAIEALLGETHYLDLDIATVAEMAAELAEAAGELARARQAYELALAQWKALGRGAEAERVKETIERLAARFA
jgi:predicted ATPase